MKDIKNHADKLGLTATENPRYYKTSYLNILLGYDSDVITPFEKSNGYNYRLFYNVKGQEVYQIISSEVLDSPLMFNEALKEFYKYVTDNQPVTD